MILTLVYIAWRRRIENTPLINSFVLVRMYATDLFLVIAKIRSLQAKVLAMKLWAQSGCLVIDSKVYDVFLRADLL